MKNKFLTIKKHILNDSYFSNLITIKKEINGSTFFIATILRLTLLSFITHNFFNLIVLIPLAYYLYYNTIKWRIKSITEDYKIITIILSIIWTITTIFFFRYVNLNSLYSILNISSLISDYPFIAPASILIKLIAIGHITSTAIMILSIILLSLLFYKRGENLFKIKAENHYCQRRYLNTSIKILLINISFSVLFTLFILSSGLQRSYISSTEIIILTPLILWSLFNLITYFYNNSNRVKDLGLSGLWSILLFILGLVGFISSPSTSLWSGIIFEKLSVSSEEIFAFNTYIGPIIDLVTAPVYHLTMVCYFILLFIPGKNSN